MWEAGREQCVLLVTDGADWADTSASPSPYEKVSALASAGIRTFVLGFYDPTSNGFGGVGEQFLNDMACAGETAIGFPESCLKTDMGYVAAPGSGALFQKAASAAQLATVIDEVAAYICCDCID